MAYEIKPNTGSLFRNDRKESDTHPDYKGQAVIAGVDHWLDAWINESSSGVKYMSLKFKPKDGAARQVSSDTRQQSGGHTPLTRQPAPIDLDDDVPFASCDPSLECRVR